MHFTVVFMTFVSQTGFIDINTYILHRQEWIVCQIVNENENVHANKSILYFHVARGRDFSSSHHKNIFDALCAANSSNLNRFSSKKKP